MLLLEVQKTFKQHLFDYKSTYVYISDYKVLYPIQFYNLIEIFEFKQMLLHFSMGGVEWRWFGP